MDLDAIRARADAATRGPWYHGGHRDMKRQMYEPHELIVSTAYPLIEFEPSGQGEADARFVAHARADVPALVAALDGARYVFGDEACVEGECDHVEKLGQRCPTVEDRFATAEQAVEAERLRHQLDGIRELMGRGITDAELREQLGDLLGE